MRKPEVQGGDSCFDARVFVGNGSENWPRMRREEAGTVQEQPGASEKKQPPAR
jgi:hypothetical protein